MISPVRAPSLKGLDVPMVSPQSLNVLLAKDPSKFLSILDLGMT